MRFKSLLLLLISLFIVSCGDKVQTLESDINTIKSSQSLLACKEIKIPQEIDLTAKFLYYFPQCVSNKNNDGSESLFHSINFVKGLGIGGLSSVIELIKIDPQNQENYPLIRAMMFLMERGVFPNGTFSSELFATRFGALQKFQENLNPYWLTNILFEMSEDNYLEDFLKLGALFFEKIDSQALIGLMKKQLTDEKVQQAMVQSVNLILDDEKYYQSLANIFEIEDGFELEDIEQKGCLKNWLEPTLKPMKNYCEYKNHRRGRSGDKIVSTGEQKFKNFIDSTTKSEKKTVIDFASGSLKRFLELPSTKRNGILQRYMYGTNESIKNHAHPIKNILATLDFFLGKENGQYKSQVKDLLPIIKAIRLSLKNGGPIILAPMYRKMAAAKIHDGVESKILSGGPIPGCEGLTFPALSKSNTTEYLSRYFLPNSNCREGLSPVASFVVSMLETDLQLDDRCRIDRNGWSEDKPCLVDKVIKIASNKLKSLDWSSFTDDVVTPPLMAKEFLVESLTELKDTLRQDPYYLYWMNLTPDSVSPDTIKSIIEVIEGIKNVNPQVISYIDLILGKETVFDEKFAEDIDRDSFDALENLSIYFKKQFIEKYLTLKLNLYEYQLDQFNNLFETEEQSNEKILRLLTGVYPGGPFEQHLRSILNLDIVKQKVGAPPTSEFKLNEILGRMRLDGVLFHNNSVEDGDSRLPARYLGDVNSSVEASFERGSDNVYRFKALELGARPYLQKDIFSDEFNRISKIVKDDTLILGANVDGNDSDNFVSWIRGEFIPKYIDDLEEFPIQYEKLKRLNNKFIDSQKYSPNEIRKIILFDSLHFHFAHGSLPKDKDVFEFEYERPGRRSMISQSFNSFYETANERWTSFLEYYPEGLNYKGPNYEYLEDIYFKLLKGFDSNNYNSIPWEKLPSNRTGQRSLRVREFSQNQIEILKILTTANLMTTNVKRKYMPLIGINQECHPGRGSKTQCPIHFKDKLDSEGKIVESAFDSYKDYLIENYHGHFCQIFVKGPFSEKLKTELKKASRIEIGPELEKKCDEFNNLFAGVEGTFHHSIKEMAYFDILNLGKNPKIKKEIKSFVSQIGHRRYEKVYALNPELKLKALLNQRGPLPSEVLIYNTKKLADHRGYFTQLPGLINVFTNYFLRLLKEAGTSTKDLISMGASNIDLAPVWLGAELNADFPLRDGIVQKVIEKNLSELVKKYDSNEPLVSFVLDLLKSFNDNEFTSLISIMSYPQDIESLINFNETMPLMIRFLHELNPRNDFWASPPAQILKILLRRESVRSMADLFAPFDYYELQEGLVVLREELLDKSETKDTVEVLHKMTNLLTNIFLRYGKNKELGIGDQIEESLVYLMGESYLPEDIDRINTLLDVMSDKNLTGFDNQKAPSVTTELRPIISFLFNHSYKLFALYQKFFKEKRKDLDNQGYLKRIISGLINPYNKLSTTEVQSATLNLSDMFSSKHLGTWKGLYSKVLFDPHHRNKTIQAMRAINKVDNKVILDAMEETNEIIPQTHSMMELVWRKIEWDESTSQDTIFSMGSFFRLSGNPGNMMEKNVDLMKIWLFRPTH